MQTTENKQWQDEQALNRYQLIAPLLDEALDNVYDTLELPKKSVRIP